MSRQFWTGAWTGTFVPVREIEEDPKQVRRDVDKESIDELAESIKRVGLIVPVIGFKVGERIRLIAGHRRLAAAKIAGLKEIPVVIKDGKGDSTLIAQIVENVAREDMSPRDLCRALSKLKETENCSQVVLARIVGRSEGWVSQYLGYEAWPKLVRDAVDAGHIPPASARHLAQIKNMDALRAAVGSAVSEGMTERQAIAWRKNADYADAVAVGDRPEPGVPVEHDPDRHKATCAVCSKRVSWSHVHSMQVCDACVHERK